MNLDNHIKREKIPFSIENWLRTPQRTKPTDGTALNSLLAGVDKLFHVFLQLLLNVIDNRHNLVSEYICEKLCYPVSYGFCAVTNQLYVSIQKFDSLAFRAAVISDSLFTTITLVFVVNKHYFKRADFHILCCWQIEFPRQYLSPSNCGGSLELPRSE